MVLSAAELSEIRDDVSDLLPDTCVVTRVTRVRNDSGGWTETTVDSDPIACRLGPVSGRERVLGGRVVEESDAVMTFAHDADIRGSDRITHDGSTYEVVDVQERSELLALRVFVRTA
jgi:SPP1 family predicted phage head-tail adaptor